MKERIRELALEILSLLDEEHEQEAPVDKTPTKATHTGTSFNIITLDKKDFNLVAVDVSKISPETSGTSPAGKEWFRQGVMLTDAYGQTRELVAWGTDIELFRGLRVGDRLNITNIKRVNEYKGKHQYIISSATEIEIVKDAK